MSEGALIQAASAPSARTVDAGRGLEWWKESWALFMKNPGMWVVYSIAFLVGAMLLAFIPVLGGLATALLSQVVFGGWVLAIRKMEAGGALEFNDLFAGFKDKLNPLLVLGVIALVASVLLGIVLVVVGGGAAIGVAGSAAKGSAVGLMASAAAGLFALLLGLVLGFALSMAFWFAVPLVVFRDTAPVEAVKASLAAVMKNVPAFLVYGVIWIGAAIVASIPFALGWLVLLPLTVLGLYVSYKDVFGD